MLGGPPKSTRSSTPLPYTTFFLSHRLRQQHHRRGGRHEGAPQAPATGHGGGRASQPGRRQDGHRQGRGRGPERDPGAPAVSPRDIRDLQGDPEAYAAELRRRWGGLLSYRYLGRSYGSMDLDRKSVV